MSTMERNAHVTLPCGAVLTTARELARAWVFEPARDGDSDPVLPFPESSTLMEALGWPGSPERAVSITDPHQVEALEQAIGREIALAGEEIRDRARYGATVSDNPVDDLIAALNLVRALEPRSGARAPEASAS